MLCAFIPVCMSPKKCEFSSFPCKIPVPLSQLVREKNFPLRLLTLPQKSPNNQTKEEFYNEIFCWHQFSFLSVGSLY